MEEGKGKGPGKNRRGQDIKRKKAEEGERKRPGKLILAMNIVKNDKGIGGRG